MEVWRNRIFKLSTKQRNKYLGRIYIAQRDCGDIKLLRKNILLKHKIYHVIATALKKTWFSTSTFREKMNWMQEIALGTTFLHIGNAVGPCKVREKRGQPIAWESWCKTVKDAETIVIKIIFADTITVEGSGSIIPHAISWRWNIVDSRLRT